VDPSGPLATLRKLLLSEESIATFKKWITSNWYAVAFIVAAILALLVSIAGDFVRQCNEFIFILISNGRCFAAVEKSPKRLLGMLKLVVSLKVPLDFRCRLYNVEGASGLTGKIVKFDLFRTAFYFTCNNFIL
jgi:hypothetical protein